MVEIKVNLTTPDGELLDSFKVHAKETDAPALKVSQIALAEAVRRAVEFYFEVPEEG
jgi:hypothetical protein